MAQEAAHSGGNAHAGDEASGVANALASRVSGHVHIIGAGLLGASIGLGLRARGVDVTLEDVSPTTVALASDYGAGRARTVNDPEPQLVIIATPPDVVADVIERALAAYPNAVVTDVASIKLAPFQELKARGVNLRNYVGSHPMAGRERGGAIMARADLFAARPWVICRDSETPAAALSLIEAVALELGATPLEMTPACSRAASSTSASRVRACATRPASRRATPSCGCRSSVRTGSRSSMASRQCGLTSPS